MTNGIKLFQLVFKNLSANFKLSLKYNERIKLLLIFMMER